MVDFAQLKKNRASDFDKLNKELAKVNQPNQTNKDDKNFWKPTVDKVGNGFAMIRFLAAPQNEDVPFVRMWDHAFQGPGGWYIENSLTTLQPPQTDPVGEYNRKLWNSGIEDDKATARKMKRRLHYISNILVVKDSAAPENEGNVFEFKYGKKIFDKVNDAVNPVEGEGDEPYNPFDLWEGANFRLKIRQVEGYRNYDKSEFDAASAIADTDEEIEAIWKQCHSLQAHIAPSLFKSYDELKKRLDKALGVSSTAPATSTPAVKAAPQPNSVKVSEDDVPFDVDIPDDELKMFQDLVDQ